MDAKTIQEKSKALVKATNSKESPSIIVGILLELKKGVVATEEILRSTRIGVTVSKFKNHSDADVARQAQAIVKKWRDEVAQRSANGKKGRATPPKNTSSPAPTQNGKSSVPPDQRTWKKDGVNINRTGQDTRNSCIGLLYDGLCPNSTTSSSTIVDLAVTIEAAAFKALGPEDRPDYKAKMRSLYQNLKNKSNPGLRVRVMSGEITPDKFVIMTHDELKSAERKKEEEALKKENMRLAEAPQAEKSVSTSLTCGKCGQKKVSYSQAQTRSADEPMTTFCECLVCGKRWKFS